MKAKLKETQAALAGEMSGHFFFKERWFGFDDGIYAAARLLEILDQEDRPAKEIFDELPNSVSTPELNCKTQEGENYEFMEAQKELTSLNSVFNKEYEFVNEEVKDIFDSTLSQLDPKSHDFFGSFYQNVLKKYSFFSSRDLRNIQKAVDSRIIDFDMPEEWWDDSSLFFKQGYDTKMEMLKKLTIENMGELTFSEIRLREALFYIDTAVRINNTGLNREIDETAKQMFVNEKAREEMRKKYS